MIILLSRVLTSKLRFPMNLEIKTQIFSDIIGIKLNIFEVDIKKLLLVSWFECFSQMFEPLSCAQPLKLMGGIVKTLVLSIKALMQKKCLFPCLSFYLIACASYPVSSVCNG